MILPLDSVAQPSALTEAVTWLESLLLGSVATAIATVAVAAIGFLALTGRIHYRDAGRVVIGCFILFGAHSIAAGIHAASQSIGGGSVAASYAAAPPPPVVPPRIEAQPATGYDPFAGASAPTDYGTCCD